MMQKKSLLLMHAFIPELDIKSPSLFSGKKEITFRQRKSKDGGRDLTLMLMIINFIPLFPLVPESQPTVSHTGNEDDALILTPRTRSAELAGRTLAAEKRMPVLPLAPRVRD